MKDFFYDFFDEESKTCKKVTRIMVTAIIVTGSILLATVIFPSLITGV